MSRVHLGRGDAAMRLFRRGGNHDVRISGCVSVRYLAVDSEATGFWSGTENPRWVRTLFTPRRGYLHHGIYVGARKVVHYSGFTHGLRRGPVEEVPSSLISRADSASG